MTAQTFILVVLLAYACFLLGYACGWRRAVRRFGRELRGVFHNRQEDKQ